MKNLVVAFLVFTSFSLNAQKLVEKQVDYQGENVEIKLDLASNIEVETWDKSAILVKASVETEDPKHIKKFDLLVTRKGSGLEIASNSKELFKMAGDDNLVINEDDEFEINYTIYLPKGVQLDLSSITGNLISEYLEGDIAIELITGNIEIKKFEGDLKLKTVTGKINLPAKNTSFQAETVMGEIYANADPNLVKEERFVGQEMRLDLGETKNRLTLNTVTGDIYLK